MRDVRPAKGYAFVELSTGKDAKDAVAALNGQRFMGNVVKVELAQHRG